MEEKNDNNVKENQIEQPKKCGIIMPISKISDYSEEHWKQVQAIISNAIEKAGLVPMLVWDSDQTNIIHAKIVGNLYEYPIAVCDISGKNANVMFELGLRLAFDKPTIIIVDNNTSVAFDISTIEYITYDKDLSFFSIQKFIDTLSGKLAKTMEASQHPEYKSFLSNFGPIKAEKPKGKEYTTQDFLVDEIKTIKRAVGRIANKPYIININSANADIESSIDDNLIKPVMLEEGFLGDDPPHIDAFLCEVTLDVYKKIKNTEEFNKSKKFDYLVKKIKKECINEYGITYSNDSIRAAVISEIDNIEDK